MKIACAVLLTLAAVCSAEPPSPNSRYLPPGQGGGQQGYNAPSSQYGAPSAPSSQYGAPSNQYSAPSSQYGAPQQTQAVFRPSSNFGGSKPSQNYGAPSSQYLPGNQGNQGYAGGKSGYGGGEDQYNEPANYQFEYMVKDEHSGNDFGHKESRQGEMTEGEYYVLLPDGRKQIVTYEADENGYRPKIKYEESQSGYGRGPANGGYSGGSNAGYSGGSNGGYSGGSNGGYSGGSNGGYSGGAKANGGY